MLISKTDPKGFDVEIDFIQKKIYDYLTVKKGWTIYESYHRAYKNYKSDQFIPEIYNSLGNYQEALFDDNFNATSFFITDDRKDPSDGFFSQTGSIIFQIKLNKLYPLIAHRADEEAQLDVYNAIKSFNQDENIVSIKSGVDNVYRDFMFNSEYRERLKITDISDYHVFRVDMKIYSKMCTC